MLYLCSRVLALIVRAVPYGTDKSTNIEKRLIWNRSLSMIIYQHDTFYQIANPCSVVGASIVSESFYNTTVCRVSLSRDERILLPASPDMFIPDISPLRIFHPDIFLLRFERPRGHFRPTARESVKQTSRYRLQVGLRQRNWANWSNCSGMNWRRRDALYITQWTTMFSASVQMSKHALKPTTTVTDWHNMCNSDATITANACASVSVSHKLVSSVERRRRNSLLAVA